MKEDRESASVNFEILADWTQNVATPFFSACVLIETFGDVDYSPFYEGVMGLYTQLQEQGSQLDATAIMQKTFSDFYEQLHVYAERFSIQGEYDKGSELDPRTPHTLEDCYRLKDAFFSAQKMRSEE